jgi:hypothetical protein
VQPLIEPLIGTALGMWEEAFKDVLPTAPNWGLSLTLFWVLPVVILALIGIRLDPFFRGPRRTVWRIVVPCFLTAICTLFLSSTIPLATRSENAGLVQAGQGGSGGNVGSISGERLHVATGKGGVGGCGGVGGAGGGTDDVNGKDISIQTGQGGDAGGCDGRGARRAPSPAEMQGWPTQMWTFGYGGQGGDAPTYTHRLEILTRIRREYMKAFPFEIKYLDAGVQQVPINWVNKRLEELGETWRVTQGEDGYLLPRLDAQRMRVP